MSSAAAIKWIHGLMNITRNPVDSPLVQQVVSNAKRFLHNPPNQKLPLTLSQLKMVLDNLVREESTPLELGPVYSRSRDDKRPALMVAER